MVQISSLQEALPLVFEFKPLTPLLLLRAFNGFEWLFGNILYVVCMLCRRQDVFWGWVMLGGLNIGGEPETQQMWGICMMYGNFPPHKWARSGERLDKIPDNFSKNPMIEPPNENKKNPTRHRKFLKGVQSKAKPIQHLANPRKPK